MIPHSKPTLGPRELQAIRRVLSTGQIGLGGEVDALEADLRRLMRGAEATATQSGTAALHLALLGLGVGPGDRVGVPSYSCAALIHAVRYVGARPVLVDVDPSTLCIDPADARRRLRRARAAVVPHTFGKRAPLEDLPRIPIIEDCATALGPGYGTTGAAGVTSFYATKLVAAGQGGAVWSRDRRAAARIRDRVGYDKRDDYEVRYNYRLSALAAAPARVQLARLPEFRRKRRRIADLYYGALDGLPLVLPPRAGHLFYRYVVRTPRAEALMRHLMRQGVETVRPVWRPLHAYFGLAGFPGATQAHREAVSLPIYPSLAAADARRVARSVREFLT